MTAVFMDPESARGYLLDELRENQTWIGTLKKVQATFLDNAGIVASCDGFILWHLSEIERLSRELKNAGDRS